MTRRPLAVLVAVAALALAGCTAAPTDTPPPRVPSQSADLTAARAKAALAPCPAAGTKADLPELTLPCLGGGPGVPLARLGGVPTVLNAWASWCGPCREELPTFERLAGAAGSRLRVLGVDTEDADGSALDFAAARGVHFASVVDTAGTLRTGRRIAGLPFTLFVRADGSVASVHIGPLEYDDLVAEVGKQLGVSVG
jgi:cytochrome c biogenesis protein CcmG/thiol:disulfide interchange protein DsbE